MTDYLPADPQPRRLRRTAVGPAVGLDAIADALIRVNGYLNFLHLTLLIEPGYHDEPLLLVAQHFNSNATAAIVRVASGDIGLGIVQMVAKLQELAKVAP